MDGRRRQWVPIASDLAWTRTIRLLSDKFGIEGPWLWVLVLGAAKRGSPQGTFRWYSESEGWERVGWDATGLPRPNFTLKEFFAYTGQTRRTRLTGAQQVEIRAWEDWNQAVRREQKLEQKTRKRAKSMDANSDAKRPPYSDLDLDSDIDSERRRVAHQREENRKQAEDFLAVLKRQTEGQP